VQTGLRDVEARESQTVASQPVDVRRLNVGRPVAAEVAVALVIGKDEDDVRPGGLGRRSGRPTAAITRTRVGGATLAGPFTTESGQLGKAVTLRFANRRRGATTFNRALLDGAGQDRFQTFQAFDAALDVWP